MIAQNPINRHPASRLATKLLVQKGSELGMENPLLQLCREWMEENGAKDEIQQMGSYLLGKSPLTAAAMLVMEPDLLAAELEEAPEGKEEAERIVMEHLSILERQLEKLDLDGAGQLLAENLQHAMQT